MKENLFKNYLMAKELTLTNLVKNMKENLFKDYLMAKGLTHLLMEERIPEDG
jgi:hypothetical protein